jgi:hypothetical protein
LKIKTKIVSCHTADCKSVKQEVNGTVILPPLVLPGRAQEASAAVDQLAHFPKFEGSNTADDVFGRKKIVKKMAKRARGDYIVAASIGQES